MTLALYVARRFLKVFGLLFGVFFAVLFLIDMVEQIRRFDGLSLGLRQLAFLSVLHTPASFYPILPLVTVLAGVALFLGLARSSELVVIRAAGRSALRLLVGPVLVAFVLGALVVALFNPVVAATSKRYETQATQLRRGVEQVVSIGAEGVWLRQGARGPEGEARQTVIHAARANTDATVLYDVSFLIFAPGKGPVRRIDAARADLETGRWVLRAARDWPFEATPNPEAAMTRHDRLVLGSELTPERIRDSFGTPSTIAIWDLPDFITGLERAGFSTRRHAVWLQMELALPLVFSVMVLIAAGFSMRHARLGGTGRSVLLALVAGLGVFFLRDFAQVLGENGQIPVMLAAWAPPVAGLMLALGLILHLEDG
ncbi:LPS export ABC transporter permease LptG [Phaeovulum vinaykumarii]|uniref:Lipopolysaccharide export system permease protein n=1 Tax=Phaeovulum vinaykumarii TaxID=407234 RepID=A0A1N7K4L1_9RHOB|nr:LPS export ABC transporter permease LptG [Phaeovulum vinaykumarii]SIS56481.1 lipopolysaccharide export system permease protein [Phaeovulum vinaykumarii]SOB92888.1 lipopolysaccharide export system permease protein [Phaeovulum vinaykumarii]